MPRSQSLLLMALLACVVACLVCRAAAAPSVAPDAYVPQTSRRYTMLVEELTGGLDETGTRPTLVSITEETTLRLPAKSDTATAAWEGDAEGSEVDAAIAEHLTFDEDFDPIWYYVLRRRGFEHLDWSGCGGKWRPEWSIPKQAKAAKQQPDTATAAPSPTAFNVSDESIVLFHQLRHYLAHHAVCTYSSVSFCGASHERSAESQFQWAAQFVSTLTSSPLSWTDASPRHSRPNGILLENPSETPHNGAGEYWCSYHLVYHDTLCTQHVSPLLNGGRSGRGVQEGLPHGIFKAGFPSFVQFFGSPFHHFTVKATQRRRPARQDDNATGFVPASIQLKVDMRMSMVVREKSERTALAQVWARELPAYAAEGRLKIHVGPGGLSRRLRAALPASAIVSGRATKEDAAATPRAIDAPSALEGHSTAAAVGWSPEVTYEVRTHGKDHGYLSVKLQPSLATLDAEAGVHAVDGTDGREKEAAKTRLPQFRLREGDLVRTLLLFPLHLTRPSLYNMESLLGSTRIVHAHTDVSSNTLAVLLETPVTAAHAAAYRAAYEQARESHKPTSSFQRRQTPEGVLLGRFPLFFGWSALHEMPPDGNSNRLVPQPVVAISRAPPAHSSSDSNTRAVDDFCTASRPAVPSLDHVNSLDALFQMLNHTFMWVDGKAQSAKSPALNSSPPQTSVAAVAAAAGNKGEALRSPCVYWVRSTVASGTTIPGPDAAMVFNVLSLGLVFAAIGAGMITRQTRRLTCSPEELQLLLEAEEAAASPKAE